MPQSTRFFDRPFLLPALLLALALFVGLWIVGWGIGARGSQNTITVTGSASTEARADEVTWIVDVRRTAYDSNLASASAGVAADAQTLATYLQNKNFASSSITTSVVSTDQIYTQNGPNGYNVRASVTLQSSDVDGIDKFSHNIAALSNVAPASFVSPNAPQYFVSSLPQLRVSLLGDAIKDAKARAVSIAQSGGSSVGALQSASSGVVQVLAPNSTNVEDYGQYDTSTIKKEISVTAHASFYVK